MLKNYFVIAWRNLRKNKIFSIINIFVLTATVIAWPCAWWVMNSWLNGFAYHVNINAWTFIISGIFAVLVASLTVSYQAIKAALLNPVKSLKTE